MIGNWFALLKATYLAAVAAILNWSSSMKQWQALALSSLLGCGIGLIIAGAFNCWESLAEGGIEVVLGVGLVFVVRNRGLKWSEDARISRERLSCEPHEVVKVEFQPPAVLVAGPSVQPSSVPFPTPKVKLSEVQE